MLATVSIVVLIFVIVVLFAIRFNRVNSTERSIRSYKRRLGTIAEVVEQTAQVRTGQVHTTPVEHKTTGIVSDHLGPDQDVHRQQDHLTGEFGDRVHMSNEGRLVFGDVSITPVVPPKPPIYEDRPHRRMTANRRARTPSIHNRRFRRPIIAAGLAVVVVGGVVGGEYLSTPSTKSSALVTPTTVPVHHPKAPLHHSTPSVHPQVTSTTARLLSSSATTAVFSAPSGTYTVSVYADGLCWIGFQHNESNTGPWLAMATLGGVDPTSYQLSATGSLAITVGAPSKMTKVLVNGSLLGLPAKRGHNSYVITLRGA